jgi:hypothetical protein
MAAFASAVRVPSGAGFIAVGGCTPAAPDGEAFVAVADVTSLPLVPEALCNSPADF